MDAGALMVLQAFAVVATMNAHPALERATLTSDETHVKVMPEDVPNQAFLSTSEDTLRVQTAGAVAGWLDHFRKQGDEAPRSVAALFWGAQDMFWRGDTEDQQNIAAVIDELGRDDALRVVYLLARMLWPMVRDSDPRKLLQVWNRLEADGRMTFDTGREMQELLGVRPSKLELMNATYH